MEAVVLMLVICVLILVYLLTRSTKRKVLYLRNGSEIRIGGRGDPLYDYSRRKNYELVDQMFHRRWFIEQYNSPFLDEEQREKLMDYYKILYGGEDLSDDLPEDVEKFLTELEEGNHDTHT